MKKINLQFGCSIFDLSNKHKNIVTCKYSMLIINIKSLDYAMAIKIYVWNECDDEVHINGN
jgi:hypothetical protein